MSSSGRDLIIFLLIILINAVVSLVYYLLSKFVFGNKDNRDSKDEKKKKHSLELRLIVMILYFLFLCTNSFSRNPWISKTLSFQKTRSNSMCVRKRKRRETLFRLKRQLK